MRRLILALALVVAVAALVSPPAVYATETEDALAEVGQNLTTDQLIALWQAFALQQQATAQQQQAYQQQRIADDLSWYTWRPRSRFGR